MDESTLSNLLHQFGLSEKEVDTYLTVLELGEAKASTVAEQSGVSKRYVYSISEKLADRGFVTLNDHSVPQTIRANPPSDIVDQLSDDLETLGPALEERYSTTAPRTSQFEIIKSRQTVLKRLHRLLDEAEFEVFLSIPASLFPEVKDQLSDLIDGGALVVLMLGNTSPEDGPTAKELSGYVSVAREWGENLPFTVTVDQGKAMVGDVELLTEHHDSTSTVVSLSQDTLAGSVYGEVLSSYWPNATEIYRTEPCELPHEFRSFRHVVLQASLHRQAGNDLVAEARTYDGETVSGEIVDVKQALITPATSDFPIQATLALDTGDGLVTVGGTGAFIEDYAAEITRLRFA